MTLLYGTQRWVQLHLPKVCYFLLRKNLPTNWILAMEPTRWAVDMFPLCEYEDSLQSL